MQLSEHLSLILQVALRNLWLYRFRTAVIGALLGFGAFLAVIGLSLLRDIEASMRASITESIAGDLQVYTKDAKDDLAIFGSSFMGRTDIGTLPDFVPARDVVMANANVKAFVPMGSDMALLGRGNEMDDALDALRTALKTDDAAIVRDRVDQIRFQLLQIGRELAARRLLKADHKELDQQAEDIKTASAPGWLDHIKASDEDKLQFLETRIAPISGEKQPIYILYLGTDIGLFQANFPKFKVVDGEPLPEGRRGILLSRKVREEQLKNRVAHLFDRIHKSVTRKGNTLADDDNKRDVADLPRQYAQIVRYLDRAEAEQLTRELDEYGVKATDDKANDDLIDRLTSQLKNFLQVTDANFLGRYHWFYDHIATKVRLYEISPGETITLRSYTRSGYVKTLPVKVYGVFSFEGLEDSDLAGGMNIIDLVTFRELYGQMTDSSRKELAEMRQQIGIKDVDAAGAEDALFGAGAAATVETRTDAEASAATAPIEVKPVIPEGFSPEDIQKGLALNAAVVLKNPDDMPRTQKELTTAFDAKGLPIQVVDWQAASGIVGQFVNIVRIALVFSLVVIFIVALVIINNTIIVGTLNRMREIGTMRAIGAQKSFVVGLFLAETGLTGLLGALAGTGLAAVLLLVMNHSGLPAGNDVVSFLFSGPRLYPHMRWGLVATAPFVVTLISTLASIYAARHAAHVKPAEAMQEKE